MLLFLVLCASWTRAQDRDDFGIWSDIDIHAHLSERWSGGLWFEHRSKENAQVLDCALVMPYISYLAGKHFFFDYASEFIYTLSGWYVTCRPSVSLLLGKGNLSFALRELPIYEHSLASGTGTWTLRTRGKLSYALPETPFKPYTSCEVFTTRRWERTRYCLGTTCTMSEHSALDLFYMYYVMAYAPVPRHILGLGYTFKI